VGLVSPPIAKADATATVFALPRPRAKITVAVVFYTNASATAAQAVAAGSGTRDIVVSKVINVEGDAGPSITSPVVGASVSANPAWSSKVFDLGSETARVSIACAAAADPNGATHYRIFVD
jgi:hypothetical protein